MRRSVRPKAETPGTSISQRTPREQSFGMGFGLTATFFLVCVTVWPGSSFAAERDSLADPIWAMESQQRVLYEKIAPAVVFISQGASMGSGFFVTEDGLAVTNAHVVGRAEEVQVVLRDGRRFTAKVVERAGDDIDLALIQVPVRPTHSVEIGGFSDLRVGSWVASVSHSAGGIWTFSVGMVSNIYPSELNTPIFQTQIPLNPGASGGPVFDRRGRVVGVLTSGVTNANAINFAIRTDAAFRLFPRLAESGPCLVITAPVGVPVFVNDRMAGKGPRVIIPAESGDYEVFAVIKGEMKRKTVSFPETREITFD